MTTVINTPASNDSGSATGIIVGVLLVLLIGGTLYVMNIFPFVKKADEGKTIVVPEQVNIDVTTEKQP